MITKHISALKVDVDPTKKELLKELDQYNFEHVAIKASQEWPELDLEELKNEGLDQLRRYYAMRIIYGKGKMVALPLKVDPLAHVHVLYTKEYRDFCDHFFGEFFDHWPCDRNDKEHMEWIGEGYKDTLIRMDEIFSDRDQKWWPELKGSNFDEVCCGCQCRGI
ncbi:hypothetical protein [Chryseobacterium shigense]|uniref:Uncharacterized protein n=1 Tax=Chryseobacterium shigense TaxID=297244 RepID=A0A841N310_9FLAO|nr:hypothetical protein [Chryseobacterium shigense]MBB6369533.1 hypothetical protein [Chryseobacterium shigense]